MFVAKLQYVYCKQTERESTVRNAYRCTGCNAYVEKHMDPRHDAPLLGGGTGGATATVLFSSRFYWEGWPQIVSLLFQCDMLCTCAFVCYA